jgi:sialic acid synthase SpsE
MKSIPLIIAEIGAKYGSLEIVKEMVKKASESGADMVKFQTYQAKTIATPETFFYL